MRHGARSASGCAFVGSTMVRVSAARTAVVVRIVLVIVRRQLRVSVRGAFFWRGIFDPVVILCLSSDVVGVDLLVQRIGRFHAYRKSPFVGNDQSSVFIDSGHPQVHQVLGEVAGDTLLMRTGLAVRLHDTQPFSEFTRFDSLQH